MHYDHITLNLTQHQASAGQEMVTNLEGDDRNILLEALSFTWLPSQQDLEESVRTIVGLAQKYEADFAMIGGAPYLMAPLDAGLREVDITPLYAYSERESVEETLPDGSVKKTQVFKHKGFVGYDNP